MKLQQTLFICFLLVSATSFAQGDRYFKNKQYSVAIAAYSEEVNTKPENYLQLAKMFVFR